MPPSIATRAGRSHALDPDSLLAYDLSAAAATARADASIDGESAVCEHLLPASDNFDPLVAARGDRHAHRGVQAAGEDDDRVDALSRYDLTSTIEVGVSHKRTQATDKSLASRRFHTSWAMSSAVGLSMRSLRYRWS